LISGGDVEIWVLPLVSHRVVTGVVFVHSGSAPAGGAAITTAAKPIARTGATPEIELNMVTPQHVR
jgi:hypothetical protein